MSAIEVLRKHAEELTEATGIRCDVIEEGTRIFVLLLKVSLPPGSFRMTSTDVLFITDQMYPLSAMDMFWTEPDLVRPDGSIPQGAESIEHYVERSWRRFSWHRNGVWNPAGNPLLDHLAFMESRMTAEARR